MPRTSAKCLGQTELFYGPSLPDSRKERGRAIRETQCKAICFQCPLRLSCLEAAMRDKEELGVWGGMGEGERYRFREFLEGRKFRSFKSAVRAFYEEDEAQYEVSIKAS